VHAVKDIVASEEILTTYVKIYINYLKREKLLERYSFTYNYLACDTSTTLSRASAKACKRLFRID